MELFQLRYFAKVLETGSISEAARQLNLSQPSLSFQIRKLEEELQTSLFKRSPTGTRATAAGRRLYSSSTSISSELVSLRRDLRSKRFSGRGPLRIGAQPMVAACFLPSLLRGYIRRPKAAEVRVLERPAQTLCHLLEHEEIDLAIATFGSLRPRGIRLREIRSFSYAAFLPPGHALAGQRRLRLSHLWPHDLLVFQDPNGLEQEVYRCANRTGAELRMVLSSDAALTLLEICAVGTGVALAPEFLRNRGRRLGLSMVPITDLGLQGVIQMAWRSNKPPPPESKSWARLLRNVEA